MKNTVEPPVNVKSRWSLTKGGRSRELRPCMVDQTFALLAYLPHVFNSFIHLKSYEKNNYEKNSGFPLKYFRLLYYPGIRYYVIAPYYLISPLLSVKWLLMGG